MEHKKMLMKLLEDYQPFMYNHYVQDDVKNYAYLNEVADAILNLNKAFVSGRSEQFKCSCGDNSWEYNKVHDSRRCMSCGNVQTNI